jgi:antitoxin component YwqK of YwqJK toxin-antitoxin module
LLTGLLQGGESDAKLQDNKEQWVKEIQLSGTFRLGGKGFASLITPRGNFWVEEGKSSSGYKLIELDTSKSQPSALIQKGDQQAWIGFRTGIVPRTREVRTGDLRMRGGLYYARGDKEPFNGKQITPRSDGSKWLEMPYVNGKRHGKKIWYEIDGRIGYETPYVDGRRQGVAITYYEDGSKKAETPWVKGNRNGTEIKYRRNGSKESETVYLNNNKQSEVWYREDGSKWKEMGYDKDQHNGIPTYYDENGIKKEEPPYGGRQTTWYGGGLP